LSFKINTTAIADYGNLNLDFINVKSFPIIIELTDAKGKLLHTKKDINTSKVVFNLLPPEKYTLRVIYDTNKNKEWDPGSFQNKTQSEEVIYFPKEIDVRANWDVDQPFTLSP
jgi:hypothetical protein